jgi:acyl dehydratase
MGKFDEWAGKNLGNGTYSWTRQRAMLYAIGVGAGLLDPLDELEFTTENTSGVEQKVLPTFLTTMAVEGGGWIRELGFPAREWDGYPAGLVHGEQGVSLARPIPVEGTVDLEQVMIDVFDKGSGALCVSETRATLADTGEYLGASRVGLFVRGQGGFGGLRGPDDEQPWMPIERKPDLTVSLQIPIGQSLIYRHLGDVNPHATDPALAKADGFDRPIFFGLGTYGFACRALLKGLCDGDVEKFGGIYGRFSKPVHPGEVLDTHIWHTDGGAQFQTVVDGERVVIDRGQFRYQA